MSRPVPFVVTRPHKTVTKIDYQLPSKDSNWEWWAMLTSDNHHDNAHCKIEVERGQHNIAMQRSAGICQFGDGFCAMQGKWDPRSSHSQTPGELEKDDYLLALLDYHADFYTPYADNMVQRAVGNHEYAVLKRNGTDLVEQLVRELRHRAPQTQVMRSGYNGWLDFHFKWGRTNEQRVKLRYTHGYGGGGPVTKDTIQANRQLVFTEMCDFLISGHTHDAWYMPYKRHYMTDTGEVRYHLTKCLKVPGYKDDFEDGEGWTATKGHPPKPVGCWWIRFYREDNQIKHQVVEDFE